MYPACVDSTNFRYIKVDDRYIANLIIYDYPTQISFTELIDSIDKNYLYDMAIYLQKQDTVKVLKDLSYYISTSKAEIKTSEDTQIDIDILNRQQNDAKNLRKKIQIDNEEVFKFNLILTFYSYSKDELQRILKSFQSKLYSKQIYSNITNFRNLDSYLLTLPLNNYNSSIINKTYRNMITSTITNIFPFYTKSVFDKNGIDFGFTKDDKRMCIIDIFDDKYLNSNITVFGSSGSGKSYFIKSIILKHFLKNKIQYIFDLEGEYLNLANKINMQIVDIANKKSYLNIMDISKVDELNVNSNICILDKKVEDTIKFLMMLNEFKESEIDILKHGIKQAYLNKKISEDNQSIYKSVEDIKQVYLENKLKEKDEIPCIIDVLNELETINIYDSYDTNNRYIKEDITTLKSKIQNIIQKYPIFCNYTNIDFCTSMVICTKDLTDNELKIICYYFLNRINNMLNNKLYDSQVIIYIDEIWRYIKGKDDCINLAGLVASMYKSIRKRDASIVCITQDISDFFYLDDGNYGKNILNNSEFKIFFKLEYSDTEYLTKLNVITKENLFTISRLEKGYMLLGFSNNISILHIMLSDFEKRIIEGGDNN